MAEKKHLYILWTNDNPITAELMVFMYGINAKKFGWWEDVTIILWGATLKLASESEPVRELINQAKAEGIRVSGCRSCAEQVGVIDVLESHNIELIYWGEPLTKILKDDEKLLTI